MKTFRCNRPTCKKVFEAAALTNCPDCGIGPGMVGEIVPVHYLVVSADGPIFCADGPRMIACNQNRDRLPASCSTERVAVTCPRCRASTIFAEDEASGADNHQPIVERKIAKEHGVGVVQG